MPDPRATPDDPIAELDQLLGLVPEPLLPLELSSLDGFLAGIILQPTRVDPGQWLRWVTDEEGRLLPPKWSHGHRLNQLVLLRHVEVDRAIAQRQWFDPWLFDIQPDTPPLEAVQPWVLGFAAACSVFPALTEGAPSREPEFNEALAQLYQHLDPQDLEDAEDLLAEIDTLEPPQTMEEAVESLVRGCLLLADISRPVAHRPKPVVAPGRRPPRGGPSSGSRRPPQRKPPRH